MQLFFTCAGRNRSPIEEYSCCKRCHGEVARQAEQRKAGGSNVGVLQQLMVECCFE